MCSELKADMKEANSSKLYYMDKIQTTDTGKTVQIMGTEWLVKISVDDPALEKVQGYTNYATREIVVEAVRMPDDPLEYDLESQFIDQRRALRHEIIHAYLFECGLAKDSIVINEGWATNEEMVDWMARVSPRIFETFKELKLL